MGIAEDVQSVADRLDDQERQWGMNAAHVMIRVLLRAVRAVAVRADARADALEARVAALENRLPPLQ